MATVNVNDVFNFFMTFDDLNDIMVTISKEWIVRSFEREQNKDILQNAVKHNQLTLVEKILKAGVDVNMKIKHQYNLMSTAIENATKTSSVQMVKLLLNHGFNIHNHDNNNWTPLFRACHNYYNHNSIEVIKVLLDAGSDINCYGTNWPCLFALINGITSEKHFDVVKFFLEHKDININTRSKNSNDSLISFVITNKNQFAFELIPLFLENGYQITDMDREKAKQYKTIEDLLSNYGKSLPVSYYGIRSIDQLIINFPNVIEKFVTDKYYYVFSLKTCDNKTQMPNNTQTVIMTELANNYKLESPAIYQL